MGLYGVTGAQQRAKVKAGAVYVALTRDFHYDGIAVGATEAEARALCIAAVREANPYVDLDDEGIDSSVAVWLLAPGESDTA